MNKITVPTGHICTLDGSIGKPLEFLSIGDYGREVNVKAAFLGLHNDICGVPNGEIMPLSEKWVVTISSQYGCSMGCTFCDVPQVGPGLNATLDDLTLQIVSALKLHPEIEGTKRLNVHYARMGEPTFNTAVLEHAMRLVSEVRPYIGWSRVHPVVSTMMPNHNKDLERFLMRWCEIKNDIYNGSAGLQISINSTNDEDRREMFNGNAHDLSDVSKICAELPDPKGRKYALNFALADSAEVDAEKLARLFEPHRFMVKITPLHNTRACVQNGLKTSGGYESFVPYKQVEADLIGAGFDVLIFVPSMDEEKGLITCGNAVLSGRVPDDK